LADFSQGLSSEIKKDPELVEGSFLFLQIRDALDCIGSGFAISKIASSITVTNSTVN